MTDDPVIRPGDTITPGDVLSFRFGDVLPADNPLSVWLLLLASSFNDLAFVHIRLGEDKDKSFEYLYWLRLGVSHFTEAVRHLERFRGVPEVKAYVKSLDEGVQQNYKTCIAIYQERRKELRVIRNALFHYFAEVNDDPVIANSLSVMADQRTTLRTGRVADARQLFADDVAAAVFTRATGVAWSDVPKDEAQEHVGEVQLHLQDGVTAFMRFANPALMETVSRAVARGAPFYKVEPVDPDNWRAGWKVVVTHGESVVGD